MVGAKPVIGVPENLLPDKAATFPGTVRAYVNQDYLDCLLRAGALPVVLPIVAEGDLAAQVALVDGLLFSGGADVDPRAYGEEPAPGLGDVFPDMDRHQVGLAQAAAAAGRPMLGICRGMQLLNVAFGGTLVQDLDRMPGLFQHNQKGQRHAPSHTVDLAEGSLLSRVFGQTVLGTNSFHHQAVKDLADGFRASGWSRDGVVEGFERVQGGFVLGVQWHPEGMAERHPEMILPFQALVRACGAAGEARP